MRKAWKNTTAASMLLALTLGSGGAAFAQTGDEQQPAKEETQAVQLTEAKAVGMVSIAPAMSLLSNPVHEQQYMKLLAKAYAPETEQQWTKAILERKQVESKLTKPMVFITKTEDGVTTTSTEAAPIALDPAKLHAIQTIEAIPAEKLEPASNEAVEATPAVPGKTMMIKRITLPHSGEAANDIIQKDMTALNAQLKLQSDVAQALESDDAAQMKTLLPQLLVQYKEQTAQLKKISERASEENSRSDK